MHEFICNERKPISSCYTLLLFYFISELLTFWISVCFGELFSLQTCQLQHFGCSVAQPFQLWYCNYPSCIIERGNSLQLYEELEKFVSGGLDGCNTSHSSRRLVVFLWYASEVTHVHYVISKCIGHNWTYMSHVVIVIIACWLSTDLHQIAQNTNVYISLL